MIRRYLVFGICLLPLGVCAENLSGVLEWVEPLELSTPRSGVVREVLVAAGDRVEQGAVLVRLEARDARAHLEAASARVSFTKEALEEAGRERERTRELYERTLLADHDLQQAQIAFLKADADYRKALADRTAAELELEYRVLYAPFAALILQTRVQPGQTVVNRLNVTPMIRLTRTDRLRVKAQASAAQLKTLQRARALKVRIDDSEFNAMLVNRELLPAADGTAPRYAIEVEFDWPEDRLWRAGQPAEVMLP